MINLYQGIDYNKNTPILLVRKNTESYSFKLDCSSTKYKIETIPREIPSPLIIDEIAQVQKS